MCRLKRRSGVIAGTILMAMVPLFLFVQVITGNGAAHAQVGGCSTLTPSRPFVYANPEVIQNGETGVCAETQPTVNGVSADFGGYGPYTWSISDTVSGLITVTEGTESVRVLVEQAPATSNIEFDEVTFIAGPYPIAVTSYPMTISNGVITDVFAVAGWQWDYTVEEGVTVKHWNETTGEWQTEPIWDDEYAVMAFVFPELEPSCTENVPSEAWVFANPSYIYGSELGGCVPSQVFFNGDPAQLVTPNPNKPYNYAAAGQTGEVVAVTGNGTITLTVNVHQVPMAETLVVSGTSFIANENFGMSVVEYPAITSTEHITNVYQVSGWAWNFVPDSNVTTKYWDYATGSWSTVPTWRDHMILAFEHPAPQPQDSNCYVELPQGYNVFANPAYINNGNTGACSDVQPTFNGVPATLIENSTLPYNWFAPGITGTVNVSSSHGITDVVIYQVDEGEILSTGVVTFEAVINPISVVSYTMQEDNLFKYHRYQVSGWQYNYVEGENVWGGFYWDWTLDSWQALPVPGDRWADHMLFEFREAQSPATFTFTLYIPAMYKSPTQVNISPVQDGMEHVTSQQIEGETDINITFPQNGEFDWSVGIWISDTSQVVVTMNGQTINPNWRHVEDGTATGHYELDPFWMSMGSVAAGDIFSIHLESGEWINLGYRYR